MEQLTICATGIAGASDSGRSFEALASEWRLWGFRLALKITGCPDAAEDALQDALLRAFRHANKLKDPQAAAGWFRRILVRCAMDQAPMPSALKAESLDTGESRGEVEEAIQVRKTLSRMRPDQRAILALAVGEGLSYDEIGQALGIGSGTVASRLHAAKDAFRKLWGGER